MNTTVCALSLALATLAAEPGAHAAGVGVTRAAAMKLERSADKQAAARASATLRNVGARYAALHGKTRDDADLEAALRAYVRAAALAPKGRASAPLLQRARLLLEWRRDKTEAHAALTDIVRAHPRSKEARKAKALLALLKAFDPKRPARTVASVREEPGPASTRIVLELDGALAKIPAPLAAAPLDKVRIRLPKLRAAKALRTRTKGHGVVQSLALRKYMGGLLFEAAVRRPVETRVFYLQSPHRIVVDLAEREGGAAQAHGSGATATGDGTPSPTARENPAPSLGMLLRRVVIDPGHGGKDPGAVSPRFRLKEKDVTLAIAKRLVALLRKTGVEATLTREDDETLGLRERTELANQRAADLFVSVHVNSNPDRERHGLESYYLDTTRDAYAKRLAQRENEGGGEGGEGGLDFILADLRQRKNVQASMRLAGQVLGATVQHLRGRFDDVTSHGVKPAMFYVLLGAKMPSILVETSYLTNARDERRLRDKAYLARIAEGIFLGIRRYALHAGSRVAIKGD